MTEAEWLSCSDTMTMLEFLKDRVSDRKLRLVLCGWSRLHWNWLSNESRSAVEVAELFADGGTKDAERRSADAEVWWATQERHKTIRDWLARLTLVGSVDLWHAARSGASANPQIRNRQLAILRDVFRNPFRPFPFLDSSFLTHKVLGLTAWAYEQRSFDCLPQLATHLESAGCTDAAIFRHLRGPGLHCRGCHVLDAILGKE
jgi:hypothetical protein